LVFVAVAAGLSAGMASAGEARAAFRVITHPDNASVTVSREFLSDAFLKKTTRWQDGEVIRAVDLRLDAPVRRQFSEGVLHRSVSAVRSYWQQRVFSGRGVPPPELDSDEAVIRYVRSHRGGIGYVSERAETRGVKVVLLR